MTTLPSMLRRWLKDTTSIEAPEESRADCLDCTMCTAHDWTSRHRGLRFHPDTRCCTYKPDLFNHQLGAMFAAPGEVSAHGLRTVRERLHHEEVSALGLLVPTEERAGYDRLVRAGRFGRSPSHRCPHLDPQGACGIWAHRNSVCSTWFCRHERGAYGEGFWVAIRELLGAVEKTLAVASAQAVLGPGPLELQRWQGSVEDFFIACHEHARSMSWQQIAHLAPPAFHGAIHMAELAWKVLRDTDSLPDAATVQPHDLVGIREGQALVLGYSDVDPVIIPAPLYERLSSFDGRPLSQVWEEIRQVLGPSLASPDHLRTLVDFDLIR